MLSLMQECKPTLYWYALSSQSISHCQTLNITCRPTHSVLYYVAVALWQLLAPPSNVIMGYTHSLRIVCIAVCYVMTNYSICYCLLRYSPITCAAHTKKPYNGHFPGKPGLATCPLNARSPVIFILSTLTGQTETLYPRDALGCFLPSCINRH